MQGGVKNIQNMKPKLNQFDELRERFKAKREAKKPFQSAGPEAMNESRRRKPAKPKCQAMYDENGILNPDYKGRWI